MKSLDEWLLAQKPRRSWLMRFKKWNCRHRSAGRGEKAIEVVVFAPDGARKTAGSVCSACVSEWDIEILGRWAAWPIGMALSRQPWLGHVEIRYEGAASAFTEEQRAKFREQLEAHKRIAAEIQVHENARSGIRLVSYEELMTRVTISV